MRLLSDERDWRGGETVLALGTFDGMHIGHAALMRRASELAGQYALDFVVHTLSCSPAAMLRPDQAPRALQTPGEKLRSLGAYEPRAIVLRDFTPEFARIECDAFAAMLAHALRARHVVVGYNYTFGHKGSGDAQTLAQLGRANGFVVHVIEPVLFEGVPVSSTAVRAAVVSGDMARACAMLGRPYSLDGCVTHGRQIGRTLGFPTANVVLDAGRALPPHGVYAARVYVEGRSDAQGAVLNLGLRPTITDGQVALEAHLLSFVGDLYDAHLHIEFLDMLRAEMKFESIDALKRQIALDVESARRVLADRK